MRVLVHKTLINIIDLKQSINQVEHWGYRHESKTVNFCNVHSVVTASEFVEFSKVLNLGDLNLPDGGPIASWIQRKYKIKQKRISGPDFMLNYLESAKFRREKIYLYGNTDLVLEKLIAKIKENFPWIEIVGAYSPPFIDAPFEEDDEWISGVNGSGANTLWVSLGCPKQELWMALHKDKINCPMLGVGAAFPLIAGEIARAPQWMRENSLEWAYRLFREPRRLALRFFYTNLIFLIFFVTKRL